MMFSNKVSVSKNYSPSSERNRATRGCTVSDEELAIRVNWNCIYSEGVASHSPGLPRLAATLGSRWNSCIYPNGVASLGRDDATPLGNAVNHFGTAEIRVYANLRT